MIAISRHSILIILGCVLWAMAIFFTLCGSSRVGSINYEIQESFATAKCKIIEVRGTDGKKGWLVRVSLRVGDETMVNRWLPLPWPTKRNRAFLACSEFMRIVTAKYGPVEGKIYPSEPLFPRRSVDVKRSPGVPTEGRRPDDVGPGLPRQEQESDARFPR